MRGSFASILALGLLLAFPASAQGKWLREPLRVAIQELLSWNLGADVSVESLEGPLVPELVLRGVRIRVGSVPLGQIDRLSARVDPWALFQADTPVITRIAASGAALTLTRSADGSWNLPQRDASQRDPSSESRFIEHIGIGQLEVRDARLSLRDQDLDLEFTIELQAHSIALPWQGATQGKPRAQLEIVVRPSRWRGEALAEGRLALDLAQGRLTLREAYAQGSFGRVQLQGSFDVSENFSQPAGRLEARGTALRWANRSLGDAAIDLRTTARGDIEVEEANLQGPEFSLRAQGKARRMKTGGLDIEHLSLSLDGQPFEISGEISSERLTGLAVRAHQLDASSLGAVLGLPYPLGGALDVEVDLDGPLPRPKFRTSVDWLDPRVAGAKLDRARLDSTGSEGQLRIELELFAEGQEVMEGQATLPYSHHIPLDAKLLDHPESQISLHGKRVDLGLFSPLLARYARDLRGRLQVALEIRGATPQPELEGSIDVSGAEARIALLAGRLGPINGRIEMRGRTLSIPALHVGTAGSPNGRADLNGRIDFAASGSPKIELGLTLQKLPVSLSSVFRGQLLGDISIEGNLESPVVRGRVEIEKAWIRLPEREDPVLREIRIVSGSPGEKSSKHIVEDKEPDSLFERSTLEVQLRAARGTRVRGLGADLEVSGDLELRKAATHPPRYSGQVEVVRGTYTFYGRRFVIRRGTARFTGSAKLIPRIDIEAAHRVRDITILAYLTGSALDPTLRLESQPALSESEVLHYLVFGRDSESQPNGDDASLASNAGALAAGVAVNQITPLLEEALPIDSLELQLADDNSEGRIAVGKYVSREIYVRYARTLSRNPVEELQLELRLDDHWRLETQTSSDENSGIDVIWTTDY